MRIAFITPGSYMDQEDYKGGNLLGTEYQIFELSKELVKKGCNVHILRRWHESGREVVDGVNIISFKSSKFKSPVLLTINKLLFSRNANKFLEKSKFDILVILDIFSAFFIYNQNVKKISITHSEVPYDIIYEELNLNCISKLKIKFLKIFQNKFFKNSDVIISLNHEIDNYLNENGYNSTLIPNAIRIEKYCNNGIEKDYILFGGRLVKEKKVDDLIIAYSKLSHDLQLMYKLKIVGFGPDKDRLVQLVIDNNLEERVDFIPWMISDEFIKFISNCSVFVLPSLYECMPVSLLEAMALGKPVIATNTYGSIDVLFKQDNGLLVEKGNVNELYQNLSFLLHNKSFRSKMGYNARKTIEENYSFEKISEMYLNIFGSLLGVKWKKN